VAEGAAQSRPSPAPSTKARRPGGACPKRGDACAKLVDFLGLIAPVPAIYHANTPQPLSTHASSLFPFILSLHRTHSLLLAVSPRCTPLLLLLLLLFPSFPSIIVSVALHCVACLHPRTPFATRRYHNTAAMHHSLSTSTSIAALFLSLPAALAQGSISLALGTTAPSGASDYIDPSFAGFGIEPSNLFSFTGGDDVNEFSMQLLRNLADYSGAPPHIRLGGNTQDYMVWNSTKTEHRWTANKNSKAQGAIAADSMIIGPGYVQALDRFPKDTPITFGLNMAYMDDDWADRIVALAQGAVDNMKNTKLYSFEVGNEPDLWLQNAFRSAGWSGKTYTQQFLDRCEVICERVLKPSNLPCAFFEPPATASTIGTTFEISQLVDDGIMTGRNGDNYMTVWNQHDYFYCRLHIFTR
jgi:hypothetical protein